MLRPVPAVFLLLSLTAFAQSGPFASNTRIPAGAGAQSLAAADFNGDGKLDMAVANKTAKTISILLGDGAGKFQDAPGSPYALQPGGLGPVSVGAGDFNRDGKTDLAFVEERTFQAPPSTFSRTLNLWFGGENGAFFATPGVIGPVRTEGSKIAAADIDGDGNLDLAVDNDGNLARGFSGYRYMGDGNGGFTESFLLVGSTALGDFNADGRLDYVTSSTSAPLATIVVNLSNSQSGYTSRSYGHISLNSSGAVPVPLRIVVADYDHDGYQDVVATYQSSNVGYVLGWRGDGTGSFIRDFAHGSGNTLGANTAIALGDFNGDGTLDWAGTGLNGGITVTLLRVPTNADAPETSRYQANSRELIAADFNGDGKADVAGTNSSSGDVTLLLTGPTSDRASQIINFPVISDRAVTSPPFTPPVSSNSGLPVGLISNTPSTCRVTTGVVTVLAKGLCSLTAVQPGDASTQPAEPISRTLQVFGIPQIISVGAIAPRPVTAGPFTLEVTTNAGLPVNISSSLVAGQIQSSCNLHGSVVTPFRPGTCAFFLRQEGDSRYESASASYAIQVTSDQMLDHILDFPSIEDQELSFSSAVIGFYIRATANSGLFVTFTSDTPQVCTVEGSGDIARLRMVGGGICTITAQAGPSEFYPEVRATRSFRLAAVQQASSLQVLPITEKSLAESFTLPVTGFGGLAVYSSNTPSTCTVPSSSNNFVVPRAVGLCSITVARLPDLFYLGVDPQTVTFNIIDGPTRSQVITFPPIPSYPVGIRPVTLVASSTSLLPVSLSSMTPGICTINGASLTLVSTGTCSVVASQAGNRIYTPAPEVTRTFSVTSSSSSFPQNIVVSAPADTALSQGTLTISASTSSGLPVTFASNTPAICAVTGTTVTLLAAGQCFITVAQAGNTTYAAAAPRTVSFNVSTANLAQTITFAAPSTVAMISPPFAITASASSGLPVQITSIGPCAVEGNIVTILSSGFCSLTASQPGNGTYRPAANVTRGIQITQPSSSAVEITTPRIDAMRNASSYAAGPIAPSSYAAIFGARLQSPTVTLRDSSGAQHTLERVYSGESQINVLLSANVAIGAATLTITTNKGTATLPVTIAPVAPGLFSSNGTGQGLVAAQVLIVNPDKSVSTSLVADGPIPIEPNTEVYLVLYGTGIRGHGPQVSATIGNQPAEVLYAGEQGSFPGLDQVNLRVPAGLAGQGLVDIRVTLDGIATNTVNANFR